MTVNSTKTMAGVANGAAAATRSAAAAGRSALAPSTKGAGSSSEFETTLLAVLLDQALPHSKTTYGKGMAGEFARSQLCHELARGVTAGGNLGIARMIDAAVAARRRD